MSQEKLITMLMQNFEGQTECIMGNVEIYESFCDWSDNLSFSLRKWFFNIITTGFA